MAKKNPAPDIRIDFLRATQRDEVLAMYRRAGMVRNAGKSARNFAALFNYNKEGAMTVAFTASAGGHIAGAICINAVKDDVASPHPGNSALISWLAVDPAFQGRGIATALMKKAEQHIAKNLFRNKFCFVLLADATKSKNPESRFYEHRGYKPTGDDSDCGNPMMYKCLNRSATVRQL
jgi:ribosomal protein S18 acetylase RimI-like enzyme